MVVAVAWPAGWPTATGYPPAPCIPTMILHVVGLKFVPEMSEADIEAHF
eukprot:COSAG01_NODE_50644_length_361_cov_2.599237_1_plen_48_part_01